ncbi:MAG: chemotaxis protein CheW [Sedimentibacter sp.]|jgi:purine-binding chemotaxis protein CheW|nr:chemotaxis protein CheW [Sedimentibacter sp.]
MNYENEEVFEEIEFPWLIFKLDKNLYTINSKMITSIVMIPDEITYLPNVTEYLTGLIHLRGNVVPLIDLKSLFKLSNLSVEKAEDKKEMVIVIEKDNSFVGLVVDEVLSVENITAFEETEEIKKMVKDGFVKGVAKGSKSEEVFLIIDEEKIMNIA